MSTTPLLQFNDLLRAAGHEPDSVILLRHRPWEPRLRAIFPWLAAERHELYNAFQRSHGPIVEKAMLRAKYLASFIGLEAGRAMFIGLYKVGSAESLTDAQFWDIQENQQLRDLGMAGFDGKRPQILRFDLEPMDFCCEWKGRLVCRWPGGERSWWRWSDRNELAIEAIHPENALIAAMPAWDSIVLTWQELQALPSSWKQALAHWRGVYYIHDRDSGKGYVGSAYGQDNLLGRWLNYAASGHGGNRLLKSRKSQDFVFSILQRVSPDMSAEDIIAVESSWKERLHTRAPHGLNDN